LNIESKLIVRAKALGFSTAGIAPAVRSARFDDYLTWISNQFHGQMGYMARADRILRRRDLQVVLPGARTVISVGLDYGSPITPAGAADQPDQARISRYALGTDYHKVMEPRLRELASWLQTETGHETRSKAYVDTGAVLERDHARESGMGFTGKNTMLIAPRSGSWFFLGEIITTASLQRSCQSTMPVCGSCIRCQVACPSQAFASEYVLDSRKCISYLTIELKEWIPLEMRPMMGNWVFGCDICQEVCPFNRFAPETSPISIAASDADQEVLSVITLLRLDEDGFSERFQGSPIARIGRDRLVRNATIAAGNWGSQEAVAPLRQLLGDKSNVVRGHAAWALGQIGGRQAAAFLHARSQIEPDSLVRSELTMAQTGAVG